MFVGSSIWPGRNFLIATVRVLMESLPLAFHPITREKASDQSRKFS